MVETREGAEKEVLQGGQTCLLLVLLMRFQKSMQ